MLQMTIALSSTLLMEPVLGFSLKVFGFALCKTWINGEKFLDGEFFFFPFWLVAPTCWYYWANQNLCLYCELLTFLFQLFSLKINILKDFPNLLFLKVC